MVNQKAFWNVNRNHNGSPCCAWKRIYLWIHFTSHLSCIRFVAHNFQELKNNCFQIGSSADWAYDTADIPCSYAVELRDEGRYGFLLPESEIKPVEEEMFAAFKKMADHVIDGRCKTK